MELLSPLIWVIIIVALLIAPVITTHEPPSRVCRLEGSRPEIFVAGASSVRGAVGLYWLQTKLGSLLAVSSTFKLLGFL